MSDNIVKMKNSPTPTSSSMFKKVMISVFAFLVFVQILNFATGPSLLMRKHQVTFYKYPIDISQNFFSSMDGKVFRFSDLKGRNVIISFWAPWCGYCKNELPQISKLTKSLEQLNYTIIPLTKNIEPKEDIENFYKRIKETEPYITGDRDLYRKLRVMGVPTYIVVNEEGYAIGHMRPSWRSGDVLNFLVELKNSTWMQGQDHSPNP